MVTIDLNTEAESSLFPMKSLFCLILLPLLCHQSNGQTNEQKAG